MASGESSNLSNSSKYNRMSDKLLQSKHVLNRVLPCGTVVSSAAFGFGFMAPTVLERVLGGKQRLSQNICFALANIGTGVYIHHKLQSKDVTPFRAVLYSTTGSVLFNYGSLLLLANVKYYIPGCTVVKVAVGVGMLGCLFWIGREFLALTCDQQENE